MRAFSAALRAAFFLCLLSSAAVAQTTYRYAPGPQTVLSNTDWMVLGGSASTPGKTIQVTNVHCSGVANAAASIDLYLLRRNTADTGGTSSTITPANLTDNNINATATMTLYTAAPTLGSAGGNIDVQKLNVGPTGAAGYVTFDYGTRSPAGPIFVRSAPHQIALGFNGQTLPPNLSLDCRFETVEG